MFLLYAIAIGMVVGLAAGGSITALSSVRVRWAPLAVAGLAAQAVLFFGPVADHVGGAGPLCYVVTTSAVFAVVVRNIALPGLPVVAAGAASNLAAVVSNGGYMPAAPEALASAGRVAASAYSNSVTATSPALAQLTDVFALPSWLPFANVFSIGDVLIGVGVGLAVAILMVRGRVVTAGTSPVQGVMDGTNSA